MIFKYYSKAILLPSIIAFLLAIVYVVIIFIFDKSQSEYFGIEAAIVATLFGTFLDSVIISFLSLTIFLNNWRFVLKNKILSFLSWFLLPMIWLCYNLIRFLKFNLSDIGFFLDNIYLLINTIPYIICLVIFYTKFKEIIIVNEQEFINS